jgi:uncharacterized glyoxalase superfamily protein PhnB
MGQFSMEISSVAGSVLSANQQPNFVELAGREVSLILASVEVSDVHGLFEEFRSRGAEFPQTPTRQPWGGTDFHVRDPDGNVISFVTYE